MKYYKTYIIDIMLILVGSAVGAVNLISEEPISHFSYSVMLFALITTLASNVFAKYVMSKNEIKKNKGGSLNVE